MNSTPQDGAAPAPTPNPVFVQTVAEAIERLSLDRDHAIGCTQHPCTCSGCIEDQKDMEAIAKLWELKKHLKVPRLTTQESPRPTTGAAPDMDVILARGAILTLEEIERVIPRNEADRDYGETVRLHIHSERAFRNSAEARVLDLEDEIARLKAAQSQPAPRGEQTKTSPAASWDTGTVTKFEPEEAPSPAPRPMKLRAEVEILLKGNGGPIDGDNGIEYVMVRRQDFEALELAWKAGVK